MLSFKKMIDDSDGNALGILRIKNNIRQERSLSVYNQQQLSYSPIKREKHFSISRVDEDIERNFQRSKEGSVFYKFVGIEQKSKQRDKALIKSYFQNEEYNYYQNYYGGDQERRKNSLQRSNNNSVKLEPLPYIINKTNENNSSFEKNDEMIKVRNVIHQMKNIISQDVDFKKKITYEFSPKKIRQMPSQKEKNLKESSLVEYKQQYECISYPTLESTSTRLFSKPSHSKDIHINQSYLKEGLISIQNEDYEQSQRLYKKGSLNISEFDLPTIFEEDCYPDLPPNFSNANLISRLNSNQFNINSQFPFDFQHRKLIRKGTSSEIYLCKEREQRQLLICKLIMLGQLSRPIFEQEVAFYEYFSKIQEKDKFSIQSKPGIQHFLALEKMKICQDGKGEEIGYLTFKFSGNSLRNCLFKVKSITLQGEQMFSVTFSHLYKHLVEETDNFIRFIGELLQSVQLLQSLQWNHGDLRLDNIVVETIILKGVEFLDKFKIIDFGGSFRTGEYKELSKHVTPEYMPPEFLKHFVSDRHIKGEDFKYDYDIKESAIDPEAPHSIDMWSVGCLILEMIIGVPLWVSQRCKIEDRGITLRGLFSTKERKIEEICNKQKKFLKQYSLVMKNLQLTNLDNKIKQILDGCFQINPRKRLTPSEAIQIIKQ